MGRIRCACTKCSFEQMIPWDTKGVVGVKRFLERVFGLTQSKAAAKKTNEVLKASLHKTLKKVSEDIELMKFNTAISALMTFVNEWSLSAQGLDKKDSQMFLMLLSPFAPHLTEELWHTLKFKGSCSLQKWPQYSEKLIKEEKVLLIVQINGKVRDKIEIRSGLDQSQVEGLVMKSEKIKPWVEGKKIQKVIFVPNKLINIVI